MFDWLFGKKKKKEPQPKKLSQEEDVWMYQFLLQFLSGPLWRSSILDFIDQNCVVFDDQQQNKFQYTIIHKRFKQMLGILFDQMMNQVGLTTQQLLKYIKRGLQTKQKKVFEQILIADDFLRFKTIMVNRNKQLENQAMYALSGGKNPQMMNMNYNKLPNYQIEEQQMIKRAIKESMTDKSKIQKQQEEMMRRALNQSKIQAQKRSNIQKQVSKKFQFKQNENKNYQQQLQQSNRKNKEQKLKKLEMLKKKKMEKEKEKEKEKQLQKNIKHQQLPPVKNTIHKKSQFQFQQSQVKQKNQDNIQVLKHEQNKPQVQSAEERKKRLKNQLQILRKQKAKQRQNNKNNLNTIVLQDGHVNQDPYVTQSESKLTPEQIEKQRRIMEKIKLLDYSDN